MTDAALHLVKVPLSAAGLAETAKRRGIARGSLDDGYLAHCILRELWQEQAPAPFVLRDHGRCVDVWGYSRSAAPVLITHAKTFADPSLLGVVHDLDAIASKPMPSLAPDQRLGFHLRACPVVRLAKPLGGHREGAELDAYQARCFKEGGSKTVLQEEVYREWLASRLGAEESGVAVARIVIAAFTRERLVRRTQGETREARRLERPDVRFEGELVVKDGARFLEQLGKGVGRHRAFGFGALILVPPGTPYPRS